MTLTKHHYDPRGTARSLFSVRAPEVLISGPAGTGKSRACLEKLNIMCWANPGMRALIVRKTMSSLTTSALQTYRQDVAKEALEIGAITYYGGSAQEPAQYRYANGSAVIIGGMDKATKVMSTEYDLIYVQEAIELTENDWESLTTRLRNGVVSFQQLIADTNPSHPTHWLKQRCNKGTTVMLDSRHEENPRFFNEDGSTTVEGADYMSKLDNLAGVRKARLRDGKWVAAEGLIYEEWDSTVHLVDWFRIPQDWTRYWAVDFGYTNPFVLQWWAEDPDGRLFMYREIYHTKRTVDQHARQALQLVTDDRGEWLEPTPRAIVCDHDAEGRVVFQRELGLGTLAANKKVTQGIQAFQKRLKERRVFIMRNAVAEVDQELREAKKPVCTEEEIVGYTWATKPGGDLKEEPHKEDDHGCDAARYVVAHRDLRGVPDIRWL